MPLLIMLLLIMMNLLFMLTTMLLLMTTLALTSMPMRSVMVTTLLEDMRLLFLMAESRL